MVSGTSPLTIFWAKPSTTAVLPTPGAPTSTGLFLVRRESTCMTRSISFSRPITGSSLPSRAPWVRLRPNWSRTSDGDGGDSAAGRAARGKDARRGRRRLRGGPSRRGLLALVAVQQLDHLLADPVQVRAQLHQHLRGHAVALTDQAEQDVLGAAVVVAELQ